MEAKNCWEQLSEVDRVSVAQLLGFYPLCAQQSYGFRRQLVDMPCLRPGATIGEVYRAYLVRAYALSWGDGGPVSNGHVSVGGVNHG